MGGWSGAGREVVRVRVVCACGHGYGWAREVVAQGRYAPVVSMGT